MCFPRVFSSLPLSVWAVLLGVTVLPAAGALSEPTLQIEAGAHTATILSVATDAAGRFLATASADKTARVWEVSSGRLLVTLRPPVGDGQEGALNAVALSPDGSLVACGGMTSLGTENGYSIYLFNRDSGALMRRLTNLEFTIASLAFSPDGRYLAASLMQGGIRLYSTDSWTQIGADRNYVSLFVDFSPDNTLVATSNDGDLRLYRVNGDGLSLFAQRTASHGSQPFSARFSPDGATIAVGYADNLNVSLLDATDLSLRGEADTTGMSIGIGLSVAWSRDGNILFAGGGAQKKINGRWIAFMRRWEKGGEGAFSDFDFGATNVIRSFVSMPDESLAIGSADPTLTLLAADGGTRWQVTPPTADYRGIEQGFQLAVDGTTVRFGFEYGGKDPYRFDLRERTLLLDNQGRGLNGPVIDAPGLEISAWKHSFAPKRNGQPIPINQEFSHALALAPSGTGFVLGTGKADGFLHYFTRSGVKLWLKPALGICWGVNISADGRVVVAAFGDGTIRWYRVRDGQELLAFFPHIDRKRWVLWTPSGYYDASPGGEDLLGWHVNVMDKTGTRKGVYITLIVPGSPSEKAGLLAGDLILEVNSRPVASGEEVVSRISSTMPGESVSLKLMRAGIILTKQVTPTHDDNNPPRVGAGLANVSGNVATSTDFYPASKFRGTYHRPDVIDLVLETLDEGEALRIANEASGRKHTKVAFDSILPPVATILFPVDGSSVSRTDLTLRYSVSTPPGTPVTGVTILVDGRPVKKSRGIDLKVKSAVAVDTSIDVTIPPHDCEVTLLVENANATSAPSTVRIVWADQAQKQDEFVVKPKLYVLAVGVSDYADPTLKLGFAAKDAEDFAAAFAIQKGLLYRDVVAKVLTDSAAIKDDVLDGLDWLRKETTSKDVAILFLAGHGVNDSGGLYYFLPHNANTEKLMRTGVSFSDIKNTVATLAGKTLFFVDTCHSGNVMGTRRGVADINAVVNELTSAENGAVVFASSTGRQYSLEDPEWGNGAFTKALVEGINGRADYTGKGKITINMLDLYLSERVKELTGGKQTPTTTKPQTVQDFPIAVKR